MKVPYDCKCSGGGRGCFQQGGRGFNRGKNLNESKERTGPPADSLPLITHLQQEEVKIQTYFPGKLILFFFFKSLLHPWVLQNRTDKTSMQSEVSKMHLLPYKMWTGCLTGPPLFIPSPENNWWQLQLTLFKHFSITFLLSFFILAEILQAWPVQSK